MKSCHHRGRIWPVRLDVAAQPDTPHLPGGAIAGRAGGANVVATAGVIREEDSKPGSTIQSVGARKAWARWRTCSDESEVAVCCSNATAWSLCTCDTAITAF